MKTQIAKGQPISDAASRVCVLFDPQDGRVVHVHGSTTLLAGRQISDAEMEKDATEHAKAFGHSVEGLKTLHVPFSVIKERGPFKVNAKGTALERIPFEPIRARDLLAKWQERNAKGK